MTDEARDELFSEKPAEAEKDAKVKIDQNDPPLFTKEELAAIEAEAEETLRAALKEAEKARIKAEYIQRRKREEGLRAGKADLDEKVEIYIDLPEFANCLRVNNAQYFHGYRYEVPRHVANSLREMMQRAQQHQDVADGEDLAAQYRGRDRHGKMLDAPLLSGGEGRA